ncbi:DMT family transporter [Sinorhizobium chiapasense]|uniref:DMT family transporter n=1 Tax=Sinorhizobium chiapasense TaxID=501572 RepID=A0ABZ2BGC5_9HYPH
MTSSRNIALGLFWAWLAILIWSGSLVLLRVGVTTGLTAYDLTALRFGVAGALLLPVLIRKGTGVDRPNLISVLLMITMFGAPYVLLLSLAVRTAPAAAAGALNPGVMAIASVIMARTIYRETLGAARALGIALTALGVVGFLFEGDVAFGHAILLATGIMWAGYAVIVRSRRVPALTATALVAVGSAALYLPVYVLALPKQIADASLPTILLQAGFQGVLVTTIAVYAFSRSAELLGPVAGTSLPALIPVVTLGLEIPVLGEPPHLGNVAGVFLVTFGVALVLAGRRLAESPRKKPVVER